EEGKALATRIRREVPALQSIDHLEDLSRLLPLPGSGTDDEVYVVFPFSDSKTSVERIIEIASKTHHNVFLIFISHDISASNYKRLVRTGNADWVSSHGVPQELLEVIARHQRAVANGAAKRPKPVVVTFLPSGGGVGNATIAIETAVQLKTSKSA